MKRYEPDYLSPLRQRIRWTIEYLRGDMPEFRGKKHAAVPSNRLGGAIIGAGAAALLAALLIGTVSGESTYDRQNSLPPELPKERTEQS